MRIHSFIHSFSKRNNIIWFLSSFLAFFLIYTSCQKSDIETISIYEKLSNDSDFKQIVILSNESQKGYTFLNPNNTKDKKNQILAELKLYSSKSDEYSQLQALKILGYNSFEEYSIFTKEFIEVLKRLNDKFPSLKSYPSDSVQSAFLKTVQQLKGKLSYVIMPNRNGVASIYNVNDLKQLQTRKVDCCQGVFNVLQSCYKSADSNFLMNSMFCGLGSLSCIPLGGPWGYGGCALGCLSVATYNYGAQLDGCTTIAQNNSCPESCF